MASCYYFFDLVYVSARYADGEFSADAQCTGLLRGRSSGELYRRAEHLLLCACLSGAADQRRNNRSAAQRGHAEQVPHGQALQRPGPDGHQEKASERVRREQGQGRLQAAERLKVHLAHLPAETEGEGGGGREQREAPSGLHQQRAPGPARGEAHEDRLREEARDASFRQRRAERRLPAAGPIQVRL